MNKYLLNLVMVCVGIIAGATLNTVGTATAGEEPTHDVPHWMTKVCDQEDSVNCWWDGGTHASHAGKAFIRQMPGREHMVCVMFVNRPRHDYCS